MASYPNYQQPPPEPSLTHELFGSPLKAQMTLQKASVLTTMLNNSMWKQAMTGQGVRWGGVVGFRGIALGEGAAGMKVARALSPSHVVKGIISAFSPEKAAVFAKGGLLGTGGVFGNKGTDKFFNALGRVIGGGVFESTKFFNTELMMKDLERMGVKGKSLKKWGFYDSGVKEQLTKVLSGDKTALEAWKLQAHLSGKTAAYSEATKIMNKVTNVVESNMTKRTLVRSVARLGKFASWAAAASIAFDVGSALGGFAVNTIGNVADRLERNLKTLTNRQMEFGGKVGIGFYSGRSGTERQRALSVIGRGYGGESGMGNEAGYQHVASTW